MKPKYEIGQTVYVVNPDYSITKQDIYQVHIDEEDSELRYNHHKEALVFSTEQEAQSSRMKLLEERVKSFEEDQLDLLNDRLDRELKAKSFLTSYKI